MTRKVLGWIWSVCLFFWQLPQEVAALVYLATIIRQKRLTKMLSFRNATIFRVDAMVGGLSLGRYIFVDCLNWQLIKHEWGHTRQSLYLGWLYLPVIGLPSWLWYKCYRPHWKKSYYWFCTERWADYLGGVLQRDR